MAEALSTEHANDGALIQRLQAEMRHLPQVQLETSHFYAPGMYCRVLARPAGTVIVGKRHKAAHFYIVCKGRVAVVDGAGVRSEFKAGDVVVSQPGAQRAVVALEDSICLTVHRTDHTDLDAIEAELLEPDETALFDARNQLIVERLPGGGVQ